MVGLLTDATSYIDNSEIVIMNFDFRQIRLGYTCSKRLHPMYVCGVLLIFQRLVCLSGKA